MAESRAEPKRCQAMRRTCAGIARFCVIACALVVCVRARAQMACRYEVAAVIQAPTGQFGIVPPLTATSISPNGRYVVGYYTPALADFDRAFCYDMQTQQFRTLPVPANVYQMAAFDVNDVGQVVGSYWVTGSVMGQRGYIFNNVTNQYETELLPHPGASWCYITGINASGTVCGTRSIGSTGDPVNPLTAFIWSASAGYLDLSVMNGPNSMAHGIADDGTVCGFTGSAVYTSDARGFVWHNGVNTILPPVPNGASSVAFVSSSPLRVALTGLTVVKGNTVPRGWAWFDGGYIDMGILPGQLRVFPRALDLNGQIFGWCTDANVQSTAFVWRNRTMVPLISLVEPGTVTPRQAIGVSIQGLLAANSVDAQLHTVVCVLQPQFGRIGDTDCDGIINVRDLIAVIVAWGPCFGCTTDFNGDGEVNQSDILDLILNWG